MFKTGNETSAPYYKGVILAYASFDDLTVFFYFKINFNPVPFFCRLIIFFAYEVSP